MDWHRAGRDCTYCAHDRRGQQRPDDGASAHSTGWDNASGAVNDLHVASNWSCVGMPWGRPRSRGGRRSSLTKGRFLSWSTPPATMVVHPPAGQDMQGALFTQWTTNKKHVSVLPNTTNLDPPLPPCSRNFWGPLTSKRSPHMANFFLWGWGWRPIWGWPWRTFGTMFSTPPKPRVKQAPPVCPHHPTFVTRLAAGLHPVPVHGGEVLLWRGPYQLELAKAERTNGDALVQWAIGGFLPPERPASCWQLLNKAPPFRNARQAKKGG